MPLVDVRVPNIGDFDNVPVVEIQVKPGDEVKADDPLITLESDKAAMDVPAPQQGTVTEILVNIGDKVSEGTAILRLDVSDGETKQEAKKTEAKSGNGKSCETHAEAPSEPATTSPPSREPNQEQELTAPKDFGSVHASPSVRRIAREFDIDLTKLSGTGEKGRITKEDVKRHIAHSEGAGGATTGIPEIPPQDFAKYGPVQTYIAPGSTFRTSRTPTKPTSRTWKPIAKVSMKMRKRKAIA
jgi:pyruvate dehydrogenase E2 component (dihydrolipoamide acetyltransferase)